MKIAAVLLTLVIAVSAGGYVTHEAYDTPTVAYSATFIGNTMVTTNSLEDAYSALDEGATVIGYGSQGPATLYSADEECMYGEDSYIPIVEAESYFTEYLIMW